MKLYTKRGDDGRTDLFGGQRVSKDDVRVIAYGEVDETSAAIGLALAVCKDNDTLCILRRIQSELFILGGELASGEGKRPDLAIEDAHVAQLERWIDEVSDEVEPLESFVLPGGTETAGRLHLARTICRRAERAAVVLAQQQRVGRSVLAYLNRLSDLLFALALRANHRAGVPNTPWIAPRPQ